MQLKILQKKVYFTISRKKMFSIPKIVYKKPNIRLGLFWDFPTAVTCFSLCMHHVCIVYSSLGITSGKDCKEKGNLDRFISVKLNVAGTASIFFSLASQKPQGWKERKQQYKNEESLISHLATSSWHPLLTQGKSTENFCYQAKWEEKVWTAHYSSGCSYYIYSQRNAEIHRRKIFRVPKTLRQNHVYQ